MIREGICDRLALLGLPKEDTSTDDDPDGDAILSSGQGPALLRIRAREDVVIARAAAAALGDP